eukprot:6202953-Alexandrium_andersonii.AAC.1
MARALQAGWRAGACSMSLRSRPAGGRGHVQCRYARGGGAQAPVWRGFPPEGAGLPSPGVLGEHFVEAVGLRPALLDLLWGPWPFWGAPRFPGWLRAALPEP